MLQDTPQIPVIPQRGAEIRALNSLSPEEIRARAGDRLTVCPDLDTLHRHMAESIAADIEAGNRSGVPVRLILPVGPVGQYPILAEIIAQRGLSLANSRFFFMDEYCDAEGRTLPESHPLSFKGTVTRLFTQNLPHTANLTPETCIFPDEHNYASLAARIAEGGIDTCYGGIGLHGHLAFNEPEVGVKDMSVRLVRLNDFTVTINAIRAQIGGDVENFPRHAYTLGMRELLSARRIRLYCRNGSGLDWANTVLRLALLGMSGDDYPVTHIRGTDYQIVTDENTLASPTFVL
ncbi:MAG: hypothetical protein OHK0023_26800 [Anaerolineae bacterium]